MKKLFVKKRLGSLNETKKWAREFLRDLKKEADEINVVLLQGNLGAGKTTFSRFLLEELGATGPFTSPTFVIMKEYELKRPEKMEKDDLVWEKICHWDCYRVDAKTAQDLGWWEQVTDRKNLLLVEWPEKVSEIWPENYWLLKFSHDEEMARMVRVEKVLVKKK